MKGRWEEQQLDTVWGVLKDGKDRERGRQGRMGKKSSQAHKDTGMGQQDDQDQ